MASSTKSGRQQRPEHKINKKYIVGVVVVLFFAWLIFDLSGFGDNIRFYRKWVECGIKPVSTKGSGFMNAGAKHYYESPAIEPMRASIDYFCTPIEAERAGYSANPKRYEFPHLDAAGEQNPFLKREDERLKSMGAQPFDGRNNSE